MRKGLALSLLLFCLFGGPLRLEAARTVQDPLTVLVLPVRNESGLSIWDSPYYPQDILATKMTDYLLRRFHDAPLVRARLAAPDEIGRHEGSKGAIALETALYRMDLTQTDRVGSKRKAHISLRLDLFDAATGKELIRSVAQAHRGEWSLFTLEALPPTPLWDPFSRSLYWQATERALDDVFDQVMKGFTGYHLEGTLIGSVVVEGGKPRRFLASLGRQSSLRVGDILTVSRPERIRTIDPERPEVLYPKLDGKVQVLSITEHEALVVVVEEDKSRPIRLGDGLLVPLYPPRRGDL